MKRYFFQIGGPGAQVSIVVLANSDREAVAVVRSELDQQRRPQDTNEPMQVMQVMLETLAKAGINLGDQAERKLPEFGVDMRSAKFESISVTFQPTTITEANIYAVMNEDGTSEIRRPPWV